jgi:hypothetical protein
MQVSLAAEVPGYTQGKEPGRSGHHPRTGAAVGQCLLQDDAPDGLNFRLLRTEFFGGDKTFHSPRHRHAFPQVRFTQRGSINYAPGQNIEEGDICFFPRAAYYGPQRKDQGVSIALQFGFNGEHQEGHAWRQYRDEALQRLKARGRFEEGLYIETDPETGVESLRDSVFALHREQYLMHTGEEFDYRPAVYDEPVLMHPDAFDYYSAAPGVEIRQLGRFFDHPGPRGDTGVQMVRLTEEGSYLLSADRAQIAWSLAAGLRADGETYPEQAFVYSPRGEEATLSAADTLELYLIELPRLD